MADFKPAPYKSYVYDVGGGGHLLVGWMSYTDWVSMEPVIPNPDGPGVKPWSVIHGRDPWNLGP